MKKREGAYVFGERAENHVHVGRTRGTLGSEVGHRRR